MTQYMHMWSEITMKYYHEDFAKMFRALITQSTNVKYEISIRIMIKKLPVIIRYNIFYHDTPAIPYTIIYCISLECV